MNENKQDMLNEIAGGEAWLSRFGTPAPSTTLLSRVKQAMHDELARAHDAPRRLGRIRAWHGSLAAAAVLVLSVGVAWYSLRMSPTAVTLVDAEKVEQEVVAVAGALPASDESLAELEELADADSWALEDASLFDAFESAFTEEIDVSRPSDGAGASSGRSTLRMQSGEIS